MENTMNRAERRAIAQGKGRITPMVEIEDSESLALYAFSLIDDFDYCTRIIENKHVLFISHQLSYWDIRDEFMEDPYLLH